MMKASGNEKKKVSTKTLALTGVMTAVTCIAGPVSIPLPISPVPVSLTNFAVYLSAYVLGMKKGTISYCIYLLTGFVGLPVFSAFSSGPAKLLGPTGGYLIGFIFMALISGMTADRTSSRLLCFFGMALGTAVCYLFGTLWLSYQAGISFVTALAAGVIPFIPGDIMKIILVIPAGERIRRQLRRAGVITADMI